MQKTIIDRIRDYYGLIDTSTGIGDTEQGKNVFVRNQNAVEQITDLFAEDGVYEREHQKRPFIGKEAIVRFFGKDRSLIGEHEIDFIKSITIENGVASEINESFSKYIPAKETPYKTVVVKGVFKGVLAAVGKSGFIDYAGTSPLDFTDYWVVSSSQDKVLYRYSNIEHIDKEKGSGGPAV